MKNFKKILALLIALIMVIPAIPVVASAETTYQTPTPTDTTYVNNIAGWLDSVRVEGTSTFIIDSKDDLIYFMMFGQVTGDLTLADGTTIAPTGRTFTFELGADIVWNDGSIVDDVFVPASGTTVDEWTPWYGVSKKTNYYGFRGTFDGQGHTIYGIVVNGSKPSGSDYDYSAFFKRVGDGAKILDVKFENTFVYGRRYVAGIAATTQGDKIRIDGVKMSGYINGDAHVGGLLGTPDADSEGRTITITNSYVDASITARTLNVGGFISATSKHTVTISNSISAATVTALGTRDDARVSAGGFIGAAENTTTMTNCQFLGAISSTQPSWAVALANVFDLHQAGFPDFSKITAENKPETNYVVTFNDCYFADKSATNAVGIYHRSNGTLNNWYDVTIDYTGDDAEATTISIPSLYGTGEGQATGQSAQADIVSANVKTYYLDTSKKAGAKVLGAQMGTDNNARIIASVAADQNIANVEFSVITLDKYMNSVTASGNRPWQSYDPATEVNCTHAYKSLKDNFGLGTVDAGENEYLVALVIRGIESATATTVLVRSVYWDKTVDETTASGFVENADGSVKLTKQYGQYMGVIFYDGAILGCFYMN